MTAAMGGHARPLREPDAFSMRRTAILRACLALGSSSEFEATLAGLAPLATYAAHISLDFTGESKSRAESISSFRTQKGPEEKNALHSSSPTVAVR